MSGDLLPLGDGFEYGWKESRMSRLLLDGRIKDPTSQRRAVEHLSDCVANCDSVQARLTLAAFVGIDFRLPGYVGLASGDLTPEFADSLLIESTRAMNKHDIARATACAALGKIELSSLAIELPTTVELLKAS